MNGKRAYLGFTGGLLGVQPTFYEVWSICYWVQLVKLVSQKSYVECLSVACGCSEVRHAVETGSNVQAANYDILHWG